MRHLAGPEAMLKSQMVVGGINEFVAHLPTYPGTKYLPLSCYDGVIVTIDPLP